MIQMILAVAFQCSWIDDVLKAITDFIIQYVG